MEACKPRGRDVVIGGVPWLARVADKARAKADGTIGEYIYPCPIDQRFLKEAGRFSRRLHQDRDVGPKRRRAGRGLS